MIKSKSQSIWVREKQGAQFSTHHRGKVRQVGFPIELPIKESVPKVLQGPIEQETKAEHSGSSVGVVPCTLLILFSLLLLVLVCIRIREGSRRERLAKANSRRPHRFSFAERSVEKRTHLWAPPPPPPRPRPPLHPAWAWKSQTSWPSLFQTFPLLGPERPPLPGALVGPVPDLHGLDHGVAEEGEGTAGGSRGQNRLGKRGSPTSRLN